jgi:hypothetical protein
MSPSQYLSNSEWLFKNSAMLTILALAMMSAMMMNHKDQLLTSLTPNAALKYPIVLTMMIWLTLLLRFHLPQDSAIHQSNLKVTVAAMTPTS